jgi:hypothetical protein
MLLSSKKVKKYFEIDLHKLIKCDLLRERIMRGSNSWGQNIAIEVGVITFLHNNIFLYII